MKFLLLPLLLLGAGAGGYSLLGGAKEETPCESSECRVTVECTGPHTCLVTCYDANGDVRCQKEVDCEEACEKKCDKPGDKACEKPCQTPGSCTR